MAYTPSVASPTFQPAMRTISAITNAFPASVTTSIAHDYRDGMIVRLNIPIGYGMQQADQKYAPIEVTGNTTFTIDIDTTNYDVFAIPSPLPTHYTDPQVIPIGEINETLLAATRNVLPTGDF